MRATPTEWSEVLGSAVLDTVDVTTRRRGVKRTPTEDIAERLGAAAIGLFSSRGFDAVTVAEVAAEAGVTARTFFRYYPTKETVVVDIADRTSERLLQFIAASPPGGVCAVVTEALAQWFTEYDELFQATARLAAGSPSLMAALLLRSTEWERRLAVGLHGRFPQMDGGDINAWALITFSMLRLAPPVAQEHGCSLAEAARRVMARFEALVLAERG